MVKNLPDSAGAVRSIPAGEDPTCCGAAKPMHHNYSRRPEPVLHDKRSRCNEKPTHYSEERPPPGEEKECAQQQRPNTAKNKEIHKNFKKISIYSRGTIARIYR